MARFGTRLVANGYPILPIQPGTKKPGCHRDGQWRDYPAWTRHAARATTDLELQLWSGWPDAGVGIVGGAVAAIDIDIADDAELAWPSHHQSLAAEHCRTYLRGRRLLRAGGNCTYCHRPG